ncbi:cell adhesion molecule CEACAM7-like [Hemitrygon akajei]|uniref:cell adhesion molecule CEACAM7-like n=1 Tax=Hemitrygon akajei TaxID=2704970 RepID=UPI003BF99091
MAGLSFLAFVLCLFIPAGQSQNFTIHVEHNRINVPEGGDAFFSVRPSAGVSRVIWFVKDETIASWKIQNVTKEYTSRAELLASNGSLLLKSVNSADSGEYRVDMLPTSGSETSAFVTLQVLETVSGVAVVTNNSTPLENLDTIALSCDASGTVETRTWFKDDQPIRENGRIVASFDNSKLTIISVNGNDAGTYKCIASNSFSSGAGETDVQVYCGCTAPETGDNFILGAGAIVGIVLGSLAGGLIGGVCAWLFARKIGGYCRRSLFCRSGILEGLTGTGDRNKLHKPELEETGESGITGTLDTNTVNASGTYENFSRKEQVGSYRQ